MAKIQINPELYVTDGHFIQSLAAHNICPTDTGTDQANCGMGTLTNESSRVITILYYKSGHYQLYLLMAGFIMGGGQSLPTVGFLDIKRIYLSSGVVYCIPLASFTNDTGNYTRTGSLTVAGTHDGSLSDYITLTITNNVKLKRTTTGTEYPATLVSFSPKPVYI